MPDTCYYDGMCGMCRRSTRVLRALDWFGLLRFEDLRSAPDLPVPVDAALKGMPMRTSRGKTLVGFPAIRRALCRTPLGIIPGALLYLPGVSHAARRLYEFVAANRKLDSCARPSPSDKATRINTQP